MKAEPAKAIAKARLTENEFTILEAANAPRAAALLANIFRLTSEQETALANLRSVSLYGLTLRIELEKGGGN